MNHFQCELLVPGGTGSIAGIQSSGRIERISNRPLMLGSKLSWYWARSVCHQMYSWHTAMCMENLNEVPCIADSLQRHDFIRYRLVPYNTHGMNQVAVPPQTISWGVPWKIKQSPSSQACNVVSSLPQRGQANVRLEGLHLQPRGGGLGETLDGRTAQIHIVRSSSVP